MTHWEHSKEQRDEEDDKLMSCWAASCNQVELFWRSDADRPVQQTITHHYNYNNNNRSLLGISGPFKTLDNVTYNTGSISLIWELTLHLARNNEPVSKQTSVLPIGL